MLRSLNWLRIFGNISVIIVFSTIIYIYYVFMVLVNYEFLNSSIDINDPVNIAYIVFIFFYHVSLFFLLWAFIATAVTDPGRVPLYWGFFLESHESRKRRYCLICHIFKPERCHHCSACNRCVLNMDHHCPWINNCVGFNNRKYFVLLVFYVLITIYMTFFSLVSSVYKVLKEFWLNDPNMDLIDNIMILLAFCIVCILMVLITIFFKFHVFLVMNNSTTIEDLEKKKNPSAINIYDIGPTENFLQVFGRNPWLWLLPCTGSSGKPVGDGVTWSVKLNPPGIELMQQPNIDNPIIQYGQSIDITPLFYQQMKKLVY